MGKIESTAQAGAKIVGILEDRRYDVTLIQPINKGRHLLLRATHPLTAKVEVFYVLFKNAFFFSADRQFDTDEGFFESVNVEYYEAMRKSKMLTQILVCYPEGMVYSVEPNKLHKYLEKNYRVRTQWESKETTVSFPISMYDRWDEPWSNESLLKYIDSPSIPERIKRVFRRIREKLFATKIDLGVR